MRKKILLTFLAAFIILFYFGIQLINNPNSHVELPTIFEGNIFNSSKNKLSDDIKGTKNVLFMVKEQNGKKTDTMLLANFDFELKKINIVSIPRDTFYKVKGTTIPKINAAYEHGGGVGAINDVENLLNVKIDNFVHIDIAVFRELVDVLGGVDFYVPADLKWKDPLQNFKINLSKGMQRLDGNKAEQLLRFRKTQNGKYNEEIAQFYDGSDIKREEMQKKFIAALIEQKMNIKYITKINSIIKIIHENTTHDFSAIEMMQFTSRFKDIKNENIVWHQLPGKPEKKKYWYFMINEKKVNDLIASCFSKK